MLHVALGIHPPGDAAGDSTHRSCAARRGFACVGLGFMPRVCTRGELAAIKLGKNKPLSVRQKYLLKNDLPSVQAQGDKRCSSYECSLDKARATGKQHPADAEQTRKVLTSSLMSLGVVETKKKTPRKWEPRAF